MTPTIRRLGAGDLAAYRALRLEALVAHPEAYGSSPESFASRSDAEIAAMLDQMAVFAADPGDEGLVGLAAYEPEASERQRHRAWLIQVYVAPGFRGQGLGRRLVDAVIGHAREPVIQLHLCVGAGNAPAIKLYQACGFSIYGTEPRSLFVNGRYVDEHMMVRFLDKAHS